MAKMGRPTEYNPIYIEKVDEYLQQCIDEETEFHKTRGEKSDSYDRILKVKLPTIEGFSIFLNVATSSLYVWRDEHKDFSEAFNKILVAQKEKLLNKGVSGEYNSTIAKLILSANHGMRDGLDVTSNNKDLIPDKQSKEKADEAINSFLK